MTISKLTSMSYVLSKGVGHTIGTAEDLAAINVAIEAGMLIATHKPEWAIDLLSDSPTVANKTEEERNDLASMICDIVDARHLTEVED